MSDLTRREFVTVLGAGLMFTLFGAPSFAADVEPAQALAARLHLGADGRVTVMTGKVECGQGARTMLTQAAAEELRVAPGRVDLMMGDTELCPDDGLTVGSGTTSRTVPAVRRACAVARDVLVGLAAQRWGVDAREVEARAGVLTHAPSNRTLAYGDLAGDAWAKAAATTSAERDGVVVTPVERWEVLGQPLARPNGRDLLTGAHRYPSDVTRPGMLVGKIVRPPALGAKLDAIDADAAKSVDGAIVTRGDDGFVGVAAPNAHLARRAADLLAATAKWTPDPPANTDGVFEHLRRTAREPAKLETPFGESTLRAEFTVDYVQHVPLEPRAAVAEWSEDNTKLTVWTATQCPTRVRAQLADALKFPQPRVRVIVPDFGGAFGGKHTGECAVEAARLARAAGRPVALRWTRAEEFQWATFRPAALIVADAQLTPDGTLAAWHFANLNSGAAALASPYRCARKHEAFVESSAPPLRHGSYRALAATANTFARECFVDELAAKAGVDPLAFRLAHLDEPRLRDVLTTAAERFGWADRPQVEHVGYGLACGTEKGSFVAACAEVRVDPTTKAVTVARVAQAYECGKILNPAGVLAQVQGCILQGLGPALWESVELKNGVVTNNRFADYRVPRFSDAPQLDVALLDRPDLPSVGGSETPIVTVAPAVANAVSDATGTRVRSMPIRTV